MLERDLFAFLNNTSEAAFAVRDTAEICFWNHAAETLFGHQQSEVLGKSCCAVLNCVDSLGTKVCLHRPDVVRIKDGRPNIQTFDVNVTNRAGEHLWISLTTLVHADRPSPGTLFVHLAHNITPQKKKEEIFSQMTALSREICTIADDQTRIAPVSELSQQETQILRMFADGESSTAVAKKLRITPQTLRNHLHHINGKLRTHNRLEAVTHALRRKLI